MSFEIAFGLCILLPFILLIVGSLIFSVLWEAFKSPARRMQELNDRIKNHSR